MKHVNFIETGRGTTLADNTDLTRRTAQHASPTRSSPAGSPGEVSIICGG